MDEIAMGLAKFIGIDKAANLWRIIRSHGGVIGAFSQLYRMDTIKTGRLVGMDKFGNKYYENDSLFVPRNRWVDYSKGVWLDYDATQVPPEWHRWLHHIGDAPPSEVKAEERKWYMEHESMQSATSGQYTPYTTTRTKIQAWKPQQNR